MRTSTLYQPFTGEPVQRSDGFVCVVCQVPCSDEQAANEPPTVCLTCLDEIAEVIEREPWPVACRETA